MENPLDLNIDALKYPDAVDTGESLTQTKSLSERIKTAFKIDTVSVPDEKDVSVPKGILPTDYKTFLILQDFLQPKSTTNISDAIDRLIDVFPDGDMRFINSVSLELAEQIPYNHPSHAKLARLLWGMGRSEARSEKLKRKVCFTAH